MITSFQVLTWRWGENFPCGVTKVLWDAHTSALYSFWDHGQLVGSRTWDKLLVRNPKSFLDIRVDEGSPFWRLCPVVLAQRILSICSNWNCLVSPRSWVFKNLPYCNNHNLTTDSAKNCGSRTFSGFEMSAFVDCLLVSGLIVKLIPSFQFDFT
jgi:hypothetical protein